MFMAFEEILVLMYLKYYSIFGTKCIFLRSLQALTSIDIQMQKNTVKKITKIMSSENS